MSIRKNIEMFLGFLGEAVIMVNSNGEIEFANSECFNLLGYKPEELHGQSISILIESKYSSKHSNMVKHYVKATSKPKRMMDRTSLYCLTKNKHRLDVKISLTSLEMDGRNFGIALIQDYTAEQKKVDDSEQKANTDSLTHLYNRHYLDAIISPDNRWLSSHESIAVLYIDLDKFKPLNDQYGHSFGDYILKIVSLRMNEIFRQDDLIFRVGGDEFLVMFTLDNTDNSTSIAKNVAEKVLRKISSPINFENKKVNVGASIGIALYPQDIDDIEITIKLADKAMYYSKKHGRAITCISDFSTLL